LRIVTSAIFFLDTCATSIPQTPSLLADRPQFRFPVKIHFKSKGNSLLSLFSCGDHLDQRSGVTSRPDSRLQQAVFEGICTHNRRLRQGDQNQRYQYQGSRSQVESEKAGYRILLLLEIEEFRQFLSGNK
jgi:hypothetical protein